MVVRPEALTCLDTIPAPAGTRIERARTESTHERHETHADRYLDRELERMSLTRDTPSLPPILLVGRGRMGSALHRAGLAAGLEITLAGREELAKADHRTAAALLCVPDAEIPSACARLVRAAPRLAFVGHTSGATELSALASASAAGATAFSLHPLQSIPDGTAELVGSPAAIASFQDEGLTLARSLAERLGMTPFEVPEGSRAAYHAAASIASNFLVALESSAVELIEAAGIAGADEARELLSPLVLRTAANWAERGHEALTGPIARGDEATVDRHLAAIAETAPEHADIYRALAEQTRRVAAGRREVVA